MTANIIIAEDNDQVAAELIKIVKSCIENASGDKAVIGLSGGSLPKFLANGMKSDLGKDIDWSKVIFIFCDERMVPFEDPESTLGLYRKLFADTSIKDEQFVKVSVTMDVETAAKDYEKKLVELMGNEPKADLLLLGMGPDGHTCSLFPGHALLEEKSCVVAHIKDSPKPPPERVTLTFPVLNRSKTVVFVSTGEGKKEMIKNVLKDKNVEFPAARVLPEKLHWIIDTPASAML